MAGGRVSLATLARQTVETVPGSSKPTLVHVAPDQVAPTPLNPRQDFDPAKLEELGNSMAAGQLQPCVGITRARYLKLFPEHEALLPDCRIVMAAGERRWKAAAQVGLPTLDVHVREDIAESRVRFLAAVLTENVERSNFNYIEEARGLQQMLEMSDGNQTQAAKQLNKSKQWLSQRVGILRLSEEMQHLVITGKLTAFRDMRHYAALPPSEQLAAWTADRAEAEQRKAGPKPPKATPAPPLHAEEPTADEAPGVYRGIHPEPAPAAVAPQPEPAPETKRTPEIEPAPPELPASTATAPLASRPAEVSLPEPRQTQAGEPLPADEEGDLEGAAWELPPGGWKPTFNAVYEQMGKYDRHMLTRALRKVMEKELGAPASSSGADPSVP
ncbi:ParB/RepB/Spo0J family partition protein [[Kitasatospora] papulosa]|uniref:ParB/RepB/Spo0J family partition protein n=1 Tax=[Kitasatospora] papulosa TaxID=1464011 RepID=UPI00385753CB